MKQTRSLMSKLARALTHVAAELPNADRCMREASVGLTAQVRVGAESFLLDLAARDDRVRPCVGEMAPVELSLSTATFDSLLQGELTLHDALLEERLLARGSAQALLAMGDALTWFLKGLLCTEAADALLDDLYEDA